LPRIVFTNEGKRAQVTAGRTVLDVALELDIAIGRV
jgi:hypothetical protein